MSSRVAIDLIDNAIALVDQLLLREQTPASPPSLPCTVPPSAAPTPLSKQSAPKTSISSPDVATLFSKALLKVAKITSVEELSTSEKLYKLHVSIGDEQIKQVMAGLKLYVPKDELNGTMVVVIVNLKAAKLAGEMSEAMILAADTDVEGKTLVRTLAPPPGSSPGDIVSLEGHPPTTSPSTTLKSDAWKSIVEILSVRGGKATCGGLPLVTSKGSIQMPSEIPDGAGIH